MRLKVKCCTFVMFTSFVRANFIGSAVLRWNLSAEVKSGSSLINIIQIFHFPLFLGKPCVCEIPSLMQNQQKKRRLMLTLLKSPKNTFTVDTVVAALGVSRGGGASVRPPLPSASLFTHLRGTWRRLICTPAFPPIRATCTGCQPPACALGRAPARSPSPAAGCGSDAAAASFPPTRSGAEARAPAG